MISDQMAQKYLFIKAVPIKVMLFSTKMRQGCWDNLSTRATLSCYVLLINHRPNLYLYRLPETIYRYDHKTTRLLNLSDLTLFEKRGNTLPPEIYLGVFLELNH